MKRTRSFYSVGALILVAAIAGCAAQNPCAGSTCKSDEDTTAAVSAAISRHPDLGSPNEIDVSSSHHVVYLSGIVDTDYQRLVAGNLAAKTGGVTKVVNSIALSD
jgi:osmotically-inducible protein OsmY